MDSLRVIAALTVNVPHPLNVRPSGNSLIAPVDPSHRSKSLGVLAHFPDELILGILSYVNDPKSLLRVSHTSKFLYAFLYDDELWKKLYMERRDDNLPWYGSWKRTLLGLKGDPNPNLFQLPDNAFCSDTLYRPFQCSQVDYKRLFAKVIREEEGYHALSLEGSQPPPPILSTDLPRGRIPRLEESLLLLDEFNANWHDKPFILTNRDDKRWTKWNLQTLVDRFPDVKFRQEAVQWPLKLYAEYMQENHDESPLYLFDCLSPAMAELRKEYEAPKIFQEDLFTLFGKCRPDYAWLILGPKRSGSTFHKDPNYTSAWNTALVGRKLWIMFPPNVIPPGVGTDEEESEVTSPVGICEWVLLGFFNDCLKMELCQVAITFPGECIYVPSGWWHSVINIDDSIALTQNFVPKSKLSNAFNFLKNKRNQVSGFRLKEIRAAISNSQDDTLVHYRDAIDELQDENLQNEDCGEISCLPEMPIFELFVELLKLNGYNKETDRALEELQKLEHKSGGRSKIWENLEQGKSTGFSFGFGFDEDD